MTDGKQSEEAHTMSLLVNDWLEASFFPWPRPDEDEPRDLSGAFKKFVRLSENNTNAASLQSLIDKYNAEVLYKLIPGLTVDGYEQPYVAHLGSSSAANNTDGPTHPVLVHETQHQLDHEVQNHHSSTQHPPPDCVHLTLQHQ
jgi:hypothetical protein